MSWREQAACRGADPNYFHPPDGQSWMSRKGLAICVDCPVKQTCLDYALSFPQSEDLHGVWGGTTANERRAIRNGKPYIRKPSGPPRQIITGLDDTL